MLVSDFRWDIFDLKFYTNSDCNGAAYNDGTIIYSGSDPSFPPINAFDYDMDSRWSGRVSENACWIGMIYETSTDVQCVSFLDLVESGANEVEVQKWTIAENAWVTILRTEDVIPGQRHNFFNRKRRRQRKEVSLSYVGSCRIGIDMSC